MRFGQVDVAHGFVDALVPHPKLEPPGVHPKQGGMRPEGVAQDVPALFRQSGQMRLTLVECSRRPGRKACPGLLMVEKTEEDLLHAWCPACEEESITISGWQDTLYADGPPEPFPLLEQLSRSELPN